MTQKLTKALTESNKTKAPSVLELHGTLGLPIGGNYTVEVPTRNSFVYVRIRENQNEVIQAFNETISPVYNMPVIVIRKGTYYYIKGRDTERYKDWGGFSSYLPRHGNQHSFTPDNSGGGDIVQIYPRQFMPMLTYPSGAGAPNVLISNYPLKNSDGSWRNVGLTGTPNLTIYNPSGGNAIMLLIYVDATTGNPGIIVNSGTTFANSITGSTAILQYVPSLINPNWIPDSAIRLISGTSTIQWGNIYDIRQFFEITVTGSASGGGIPEAPIDGNTYGRKNAGWSAVSGSAGISNVGVQDSGLSVGNATIFNFDGQSIWASVSGSTALISVSGSSSGLSNIPVQQLGVAKGNATIFNFVGNNITVSVSGTVALINLNSGTFPTLSPFYPVITNIQGLPSTQPTLAFDTSLNLLRFGADVIGVDGLAGRIGWNDNLHGLSTFHNPSIVVIGAGSGTGNRWVDLYDNLRVDSNLDVGADTHLFRNLQIDGTINLATGTYNVGGNPHTHAGGGMTLITEIQVTAGAGQAAITFNSIPSSYKHLQLKGIVRSSVAAVQDILGIQFNGDSGTNYDYNVTTFVNTPITTITAAITSKQMQVLRIEGNTGPANDYTPIIVDIPYYLIANYNKEVSANGWYRAGATAAVQVAQLGGGNWRNPSAINAIRVTPVTGPVFISGSMISLYGIS
jgi:hypothetical protein